MSLFLVQVGGTNGSQTLENHDIQFHIGNTIEECYDTIKKQWQGQEKGLHLDGYIKINQVDGYDVSVSQDTFDSPLKLYMVFMGGHDDSFLERHDILLLVSDDPTLVKRQAKGKFSSQWEMPHVDKVVCVSDIITQHIHLRANKEKIENDIWRGFKML